MKFKIMPILTILMLSLGMISITMAIEFESNIIHKDEFDILEIMANDLDGDGNYEVLAYTSGKSFYALMIGEILSGRLNQIIHFP